MTDGRPSGALQRAFSLLMIAGVKKDLVRPSISLEFPTGEIPEMHHIYPRAWCQNNRVGALAKILDEAKAERDWVNSISNMMPLSRKSNSAWKAQNPGSMLAEGQVTYDKVRHIAQKFT